MQRRIATQFEKGQCPIATALGSGYDVYLDRWNISFNT